jgi:pyruvate-formate lyase
MVKRLRSSIRLIALRVTPVYKPWMSNPITETGRLMPNTRVKSGLMAYDKTVTLGNLITAGAAAVSVAFGYGVLTNRMDAADQRMAAQAVQFTQAIARIDEGLKEQRQDQKDMTRAITSITTDTALIRGRLASGDTASVRK